MSQWPNLPSSGVCAIVSRSESVANEKFAILKVNLVDCGYLLPDFSISGMSDVFTSCSGGQRMIDARVGAIFAAKSEAQKGSELNHVN